MFVWLVQLMNHEFYFILETFSLKKGVLNPGTRKLLNTFGITWVWKSTFFPDKYYGI